MVMYLELTLMRFPSRFAMMAMACWLSLAMTGDWTTVRAQETEPTAEERKELLANQRFEEILKKKPRPWYGIGSRLRFSYFTRFAGRVL